MKQSFYEGFPTLVSKEQQLASKVKQIDQQIKNVEGHERYDSNESERQYQLGKLAQEREQALQSAEEDFQIELEALELNLAEQAFEIPNTSEEELQRARQLADVVKSQLQTASNKKGVIDLLKKRVKTMNDTEKQTVKTALIDMEFKGKDEIMEELNDTARMREINEQLDGLHKIKIGANSLRRKYDAMDNAINQLFK